MSEERITISITLPAKLVKQLDDYARQAKMDRSHFLEWTFEQVLPMMPAALALLRGVFKATGIEVKEEGQSRPGHGEGK